VKLRNATLSDIDLLVRVDLEDEGVTAGYRVAWGAAEAEAHREQIRSFVLDGGAHVSELDGVAAGIVLWRARTWATVEEWSVFRAIDPAVFPVDGAFAEIFQLWVDPEHRRQGIGTALKREVERAARERGITMLYTHTEEHNAHVLALNHKLGYHEVRRGPIWDPIIRVSLVKYLA
jgi:ribosomal protein S18 acetylase RimI-like enzyme